MTREYSAETETKFDEIYQSGLNPLYPEETSRYLDEAMLEADDAIRSIAHDLAQSPSDIDEFLNRNSEDLRTIEIKRRAIGMRIACLQHLAEQDPGVFEQLDPATQSLISSWIDETT